MGNLQQSLFGLLNPDLSKCRDLLGSVTCTGGMRGALAAGTLWRASEERELIFEFEKVLQNKTNHPTHTTPTHLQTNKQ